jgi:uncharacterized protein
MTNEERDLITQFVGRVGGTAAPAAGGSVPGTVAPLPPVDREADALIADLFSRYPEARYRVTQMAFVQEHALVEAQNRIARLQWELQQAQAAAPGQPGGAWSQGATPSGQPKGFFGTLFGGGASSPRPAAPPPPQYAAPPPQYAPPPPVYPAGYNPGLLQQQGPGFFGSALRTAAGVAGGVLAADALMSLFSPHEGYGGGFGGGGFGGGFGGPGVVENTTIINEGGAGNPWGGGGDPMDQGGASKDGGAGMGTVPDQSAWAPAPPDQGGGWQQADNSGWQDAPADNSGGWQDASNDSSSDFGSDSGGDSGSDFTDNS